MAMMCVSALMESIGVGLIIPFLAIMAQPTWLNQYPAIREAAAQLGADSHVALVSVASAVLLTVFAAKTAFSARLTWSQSRFGYEVQAEIAMRLLRSYVTQPWTRYIQRNSAELIQNVTSECARFSEVLIYLVVLVSEIAVLAAICGTVIFLEPIGAFTLVGILGGAYVGLGALLRHRLGYWGSLRQYHERMRLIGIQQCLGGLREVRVFGRDEDFLQECAMHTNGFTACNAKQYFAMQLPRLWFESVAFTAIISVVLALLFSGRAPSEVLAFVGLFAVATVRLLPSAMRITSAVNFIKANAGSIDTLARELSDIPPPAPRACIAAHRISPNAIDITFDSVWFQYPNAAGPSVTNLSIRISSGERIGIIGPSGAGKSTLIDLLLGLVEPTKGQVLIGGRQLKDNLKEWHQTVGLVPQTIYLLDASIRQNIAFGVPESQIDDSAVNRSLDAARLKSFVDSLPDGLATRVGERGVRLSGGQRQRIGIARALYRDPTVLVLDEATSALDNDTEREFVEAIKDIDRSTTVIVVAHRISTVSHCDRIIRLVDGHITASGTPAEVLGAAIPDSRPA